MELVDELDLLLSYLHNPWGIEKYGLHDLHRITSAREKRMLQQEFRRLRDKKLIKLTGDTEHHGILLTKKGLKEALRLRVSRASPLPSGHICIVAFDIPERARAARRACNTLLKDLGMIHVQKSVWVSEFDIAQELHHLVVACGFSRWVKIFIGKNYSPPPASRKDRSDQS